MSVEHQHTWLPVRTILTGPVIVHYECQCRETISVAEYKQLAAKIESDIRVVAKSEA